MPKSDYKKANEDLLKLLELVPDSEASSVNNKIIDVTEESIGTVYQFTEHDLLVIKGSTKRDDTD